MNANTSLDSASFFNLDPSAAAKQMAALNAASQARIASNTRPSASTGGTSSGPYLGGINSVNYPSGNDLLGSSNNAHANFQMPNSHGVPQTPNMAGSFIDSSMSQANPRNSTQGNTLKQRQQGFLHGLASVMAKRGNPLPPSLTGISAPNYDANKTVWTMIEPSSEVGSFRLAGKDVPLFKLWGLVFQAGGGPAVRLFHFCIISRLITSFQANCQQRMGRHSSSFRFTWRISPGSTKRLSLGFSHAVTILYGYPLPI